MCSRDSVLNAICVLSRSRSRERREREKSAEREKLNPEKERERELEREKERERKKRGLPPIKGSHLGICSTTLWVGHLSKVHTLLLVT